MLGSPRVVCIFALILLPIGVLAVEPFTISAGTIVSIIGTIGSLLSFLIVAIKFIVAYGLFILILIIVGVQFIPFLQKWDLVGLLESIAANSALCNPAGPKSDDPGSRGNAAYRNNGA